MTTTSSKPIGMIGPGLMGAALTERLLEHGYSVLDLNRAALEGGLMFAETATARLSVMVAPR